MTARNDDFKRGVFTAIEAMAGIPRAIIDGYEFVLFDEAIEAMTNVLVAPRTGSVGDNVVAISRKATDTQKAAARAMRPKSGSTRERIYDLIVKHNGLTDDEIEQYTGLAHQTASSARNGLMNSGFIVDSGERRTNRRGNQSIVWRKVDLDTRIDRTPAGPVPPAVDPYVDSDGLLPLDVS